MAARRKKTKRRRKSYFSLWDAGVAFGNLTILSKATTGNDPISFVTGKGDASWKTMNMSTGSEDVFWNPDSKISLSDLLNEPGGSWDLVQANLKTNGMGAAASAITFNIGATVLRKLLKQPINKTNRYVRKLGMGVQI